MKAWNFARPLPTSIALFLSIQLLVTCWNQSLVSALDEILAEGRPHNLDIRKSAKDHIIQLLLPSKDHSKLELNQEALELLEEIDVPVAVISVVGPYHGGKSFLLNVLLNSSHGFTVGTRPGPETEGFWIRVIPPEILEATDGARVVFLDTEGLYGDKASRAYDAKIFALATLISSHMIYNTIRTLGDAQSVSALAELARQAQVFNLQNWLHTGSPLQQTDVPPGRPVSMGPDPSLLLKTLEFPPLTWVVQGFDLDLDIAGGPMDYLQRHLAAHARSGDRSIDTLFTQGITCLPLRTPADINMLRDEYGNGGLGADLELFPLLHPGYQDDVAKVRIAVTKGLRAKGGEMFTGQVLASLLPLLVHYVNSDFPLQADKELHETMVGLLVDGAFSAGVQFFRSRMDRAIGLQGTPSELGASDWKVWATKQVGHFASVSGSAEQMEQNVDKKSGEVSWEPSNKVKQMVAVALTPQELTAAMNKAEEQAANYCEKRCVGVPTERSRPVCRAQLGAKLGHLRLSFESESQQRVQHALVALVTELCQMVTQELRLLQLPLPEQQLAKTFEHFRKAAMARFGNEVGKHRGGTLYGQSRSKLQEEIQTQCEKVEKENTRIIEVVLGNARAAYRVAHKSIIASRDSLARGQWEQSSVSSIGVAMENQKKANVPLLPRVLTQLHSNATSAAREAFVRVVKEGGISWVTAGHVQFDFSQFQNVQWSTQRLAELQSANDKLLAARAHDLGVHLLASYEQQLAGISPFPDNDEVLSKHAQAAEKEHLAKYLAALADFSGAGPVEEERRDLMKKIEATRQHLLEKNTALMTALCYDPLQEAAKALHMEDCTITYENIWASRKWWSAKCLWPGHRLLFGFQKEAYRVARSHLDKAQLSFRTGGMPEGLKAVRGRWGDGESTATERSGLSPATRDKVISAWINTSLAQYLSNVNTNFAILVSGLAILVGQVVWGFCHCVKHLPQDRLAQARREQWSTAFISKVEDGPKQQGSSRGGPWKK